MRVGAATGPSALNIGLMPLAFDDDGDAQGSTVLISCGHQRSNCRLTIVSLLQARLIP